MEVGQGWELDGRMIFKSTYKTVFLLCNIHGKPEGIV